MSNALASNPGDAFTTGMERGVTRAAMGALGQNPNDQRATNALMAFNPQAGFAMQDRQRQLAALEREAEQRRLNIEAGQRAATGDTAGARNLMLRGGNFDGATQIGQMESAAAKAQREMLESFGGELTRLEGLPTDAERAAYVRQNAARLAQAFSIPVERLASFDGSLATVQELAARTRTAAGQLEAQYGGRTEVPGMILDRDGNPVVSWAYPMAVGDGGLSTINPSGVQIHNRDGTTRSVAAPGSAASAAPTAPTPPQMTPEQLRALADRAIANGAPREAVEARLREQLEGGAAPSNGQGGFLDPQALRVWNGGGN